MRLIIFTFIGLVSMIQAIPPWLEELIEKYEPSSGELKGIPFYCLIILMLDSEQDLFYSLIEVQIDKGNLLATLPSWGLEFKDLRSNLI